MNNGLLRLFGIEKSLRSSFRLSHCDLALDFLQTPPHGDALALRLIFGSAYTRSRDGHPTRFVPCPAHTLSISGGVQRRPLQRLVRPCNKLGLPPK